MTSQNDKDMFQRTWYMPNRWWSVQTMQINLEEWRTLLKRGNASKWEIAVEEIAVDWKNFAHIFLVNRPLTFGHSQLVMPIPSNLRDIKESIIFECASIIIKRAIRSFEEAFGKKKLHTKRKYHILAERTLSYGRYIKTIIMRVSAEENPKEVYKVHLLPYFESNAALCQQRYCSVNKASLDKRGGLIGWLGDRETKVDRWQIDNCELTKIARDIWKLPELASNLRENFAPQQSEQSN